MVRYNRSVRKVIRFLVWSALVLGVVGAVLRFIFFETWIIPGDDKSLSASIAPSLAPGDLVLLLHAGHPGFSDLVRCTDPEEPRRFVIGRIVAEGGDTLTVNDVEVSVNNKRAPSETACSQRSLTIEEPTSGESVEIHCDIESLSGHPHKRGRRAAGSLLIPPIERTVQPGHVFLVSDNRSYPMDSRIYGAVPIASCDSRVVFRLWSAAGFGDVVNRLTIIQ
jgi:signal peptidase I